MANSDARYDNDVLSSSSEISITSEVSEDELDLSSCEDEDYREEIGGKATAVLDSKSEVSRGLDMFAVGLQLHGHACLISDFHEDYYTGLPEEAQLQPVVDCTKLPDGFYPAADQCDAYIHCKNGQRIEELCPDGKVFKIPKYKKEFKTLRCVFPFGVDCSKRPNLQPPQGNEGCPRLWGLYPVTKDCEKFRYCVHGTPLIQNCPHDLVFNPKTGVCDYPDNVLGCSDIIELVCPDPSLSELPGFYTLHPHPSDCKKFYFCTAGNPRLAMCEYDYAFDPASRVNFNAISDLGDECKPGNQNLGDEDYYTGLQAAKNPRIVHVVNRTVVNQDVDLESLMRCNIEEADERMFVHVQHAAEL
ncbi:Protein obstructor-E [Nymphon striatum]|nr:Protein obstructor-E [Nymphon striatum]